MDDHELAPALAPAVPDEHPDTFGDCDCTDVGTHILVVQAVQLRREVNRLRLQLTQVEATAEDLSDALDDELAHRDTLEELLDAFAYAVAPMSEIGEHSSGNCPWHNALESLGGHDPRVRSVRRTD
jgi:hypothetical protein